MTFDQAVDAVKSGLMVTRPGMLEKCLGWDTLKCVLYTLDARGHKSAFWASKSDREATDWTLATV